MAKTFKTSKGTELPLLNLRGRDYLEVKYRLVWFREEHPDWSVETELLSATDKSACAKALIREGSGRLIATSHKFESERGFPDFIEKAETGAIGGRSPWSVTGRSSAPTNWTRESGSWTRRSSRA